MNSWSLAYTFHQIARLFPRGNSQVGPSGQIVYSLAACKSAQYRLAVCKLAADTSVQAVNRQQTAEARMYPLEHSQHRRAQGYKQAPACKQARRNVC